MTISVGKYIQLENGQTVWHEVNTPAPTFDNTTNKLLFLTEAVLFHGCTRKEALMLWDDGIDTLYSVVESIHTQSTPEG
jgi:hypothetical protein